MKNRLLLILFTFITLYLFQNCGSKSNNVRSDFSESNSENNISDSICSIHNKNCLAVASELGMNLEDYHNWQNEQQESIEMEDANVDANGDIVDPNTAHENVQNQNSQKQWINCKNCHGQGTLICSNCEGSRTDNCSECGGDGLANSMEGEYRCNKCHGSGIQNCKSCSGRGTGGACSYCDGRGQVLVSF